MTFLIDKDQGILSPALVPAQDDARRDGAALTIGLINNMPDPALKATERQFMRLLQAAAGPHRIRFHCFSLPSVRRSPDARWHVGSEYSELAELEQQKFDGLIVTGAEPVAPDLDQEPYWRDLTDIIDWAKTNTRSAIWSCLAAHAAVLHLDRIVRQPLPVKCHGIFDCETVVSDPLTRAAPAPLKVSHSRLNEVSEADLTRHGYEVLTRSREAGVDIFVRQYVSRFVFFQGHPEYGLDSLLREYRRDMGRYLRGENRACPPMPEGYFDRRGEEALADFTARALEVRDPELLASFPERLQPRAEVAAGWRAPAISVFRNWLSYLAERKPFRVATS